MKAAILAVYVALVLLGTQAVAAPPGDDHATADLIAAFEATFAQPRLVGLETGAAAGGPQFLVASEAGAVQVAMLLGQDVAGEFWLEGDQAWVRNRGVEVGVRVPDVLQGVVNPYTAQDIAVAAAQVEPDHPDADLVEAIVGAQWLHLTGAGGDLDFEGLHAKVVEEADISTTYELDWDATGPISDVMLTMSRVDIEGQRVLVVVTDGEVTSLSLAEVVLRVGASVEGFRLESPDESAAEVPSDRFLELMLEAERLAALAASTIGPDAAEMEAMLVQLRDAQVAQRAAVGAFSTELAVLAQHGFDHLLGTTVVVCLTEDGTNWAAMAGGTSNFSYLDSTMDGPDTAEGGDTTFVETLVCTPTLAGR